MKIHKSITSERIEDACNRRLTTLDNPGFCIACGNEQDGCEPDAEKYECEACGERPSLWIGSIVDYDVLGASRGYNEVFMSDQPFDDDEPRPIRERGRRKVKNPLIIKVLVFDVATDCQIREHKEVNFSLAKHREWVNNLIVWACCNGKSVEIVNPADDK